MAAGELDITADPLEGGGVAIRVAGEIDLSNVDALVAAVEPQIPAGGTVELDLRLVAFMDSAGVAAVNRVRRFAVDAGDELVVRCLAEGPVAQLIEWTGLDRVVDVRRETSSSA